MTPNPEEDNRQDQGSSGAHDRAEIHSAAAGGVVVSLAIFLATWAAGRVSDAEARILLESVLPSIRFLASSVLTVGATIMALMATVLSFSQSSQLKFRTLHYRRIRRVSMLNAVAIVAAILILLLMTLPLQESDQMHAFYTVVYYGMLAGSSLLAGLEVGMILLLHGIIKGLSTATAPTDSAGPLIRTEDET